MRRILMLMIVLSSLIGLVTAQQADRFADVTMLRAFGGHTDFVFSVAFSPDGRTLVSGSYDNTVRMWDISNGKSIHTLLDHTDHVWSVAFSPDGNTLASSSSDGSIRLRDTSTGRLTRTLTGTPGLVSSVIFSPDGQTLANGHNLDVQLWNVSSGSLIRTFKGHSNLVWSVVFSPDGRTLASGSSDQDVRLWDVSSGKLIRNLKSYTNQNSALAFSPDGRILASASYDKNIQFWDMSDGSSIRTLQGHTKQVVSIAFSPDGRIFASASGDRTIRFWNTTSGSLIHTLTWNQTEGPFAIAFSPDGRYLASGSSNGTVRLSGLTSGEQVFGASQIWLKKYGPKPGFLEIRSKNNQNAIVTINGEDKGVIGANRSLELAPDTYTITVAATGFEPKTQTIVIKSSETTKTVFDLEPLDGILKIRSGNENADITINGELVGKTGATRDFKLKPGNYTVAVSASGFQTQTQTITIKPNETTDATFNLESSTAILMIRSGTPTATISINGETKGATGATREFKLQPGSYTIVVAAPGFKTQTQTVTIQPGQDSSLTFNLDRSTGTLAVSGAAANASVNANGKTLGTTGPDGTYSNPNLEPGTYAVTVVKDGFETFSQTVSVTIDQTSRVTATRNAKPASIRMTGLPTNASVTLDPQAATQKDSIATNGTLEVSVTMGSEERKTIKATIGAAGYSTRVETITVQAGRTTELAPVLEFKPGAVVISSVPTNATVTRDGREIGKTPLRLSGLPPGTVTVTVTLAGREAQTVTINVQPGETITERVTLKSGTTMPPSTPASKPAPSSPATNPTETAPPISTSPRANIRALVIGIGNYQEDRIPKLEYAESDAKRFAEALKNPRIGNIKAENIETMIGPRATKNRFETRARNLAGQTKPGETLIVYYSGHGAPDPEKNQPWLVPWDADPNDLASSAIALEWLQTLPLAGGNLVLILDSCFSGETGSRSVTVPNARPFGVQVKAPATTGNVTVLSATSGSQSSFEGPSTNGGYFTTYLIEGMSGKADTNADGTVTLEEAMRYATPKVTLEASKRNAKQTPELRGTANFVLGLDAATLASKGVQTRVDKLAVLAQTGKISADQFLALEKLVENASEPDPLRRYLDGELKEDDFVKLLKNGLVHPSVPKR
jgi:WD40 repeat protein